MRLMVSHKKIFSNASKFCSEKNHLITVHCIIKWQVSGRMMAVEILGQLLVSANFRKIDDNTLDQELLHYTTRPVLLQALLLRCSDKMPT